MGSESRIGGSGRIRLRVTEWSDGETLEAVVRRASWPMAMVNTDDWCGHNRLPEIGLFRATVRHVAGEWAWDDDGDGSARSLNTLEGLRTGPRNFRRLFRGGEQGVPPPMRGDVRMK